MAAWAPIIAAIIGAGASSQGSKKAAKNAKPPQVPTEFRGPLMSALNLITGGIRGSVFDPNLGAQVNLGNQPSPFAAGINPLQEQALSLIGGMLPQATAAGQGGLDEALNTIRGVAATGLDPGSIRTISDQLAPFFESQRERGVAGVRESEAAGGRFFSSGGVRAESDFLNRLAAEQSAQVLPLALQAQSLRLGAAQSIPGLITGTLSALQGLGLNALQAGEVARNISTQQLPIQGVPFLASLLSGTPFFTPPVPSNFLQFLGPQISSLAGQPGLFQGKGGNVGTGVSSGGFGVGHGPGR